MGELFAAVEDTSLRWRDVEVLRWAWRCAAEPAAVFREEARPYWWSLAPAGTSEGAPAGGPLSVSEMVGVLEEVLEAFEAADRRERGEREPLEALTSKEEWALLVVFGAGLALLVMVRRQLREGR